MLAALIKRKSQYSTSFCAHHEFLWLVRIRFYPVMALSANYLTAIQLPAPRVLKKSIARQDSRER